MEPLLYTVVALGGLVALALPGRDARLRVLGVVVFTLAAGAYLTTALIPHEPKAGGEEDPANVQRPLKSGDGGYVSSDACASCHPSQYATWHDSYHRTMTQVITPETMIPEWSGTLQIGGKSHRLDREGDQFWVATEDRAQETPTRQRVLMATGSHHQQVYWVATGVDRELRLLSFTWLLEEERWIPYRHSFLQPDDLPESELVWNGRCIFCHSTGGQPQIVARPQSVDTRIGELGIACEACHGPGEQHVRANRSTWRRYLLHLTGGEDNTIVQPARLPTDRANEICGQCHSVMASSDGLAAETMLTGSSYRPGDVLSDTRLVVQRPVEGAWNRWRSYDFDTFTWEDGQIRTSGRDYNAIVQSECTSGNELSCLSCHSMHDSDPEDQLARNMDGDEACFQCHNGFRQRVSEHSHHLAESSGSRCYNCHMPHTTYGLLKAIRSHTIGRSPSVRESLEVGRPNACNLCHLDKTLAWTDRYLEEWYDQPPMRPPGPEEEQRSAALLWLLRGDALQRTLVAWHMGWGPAKEASGTNWMAPFLAYALEDPYSAVRFIAARSLSRLPGFENFSYDYVGPHEQRQAARRRAQQRWLDLQRGDRPPERFSTFLGPGGSLEDATVRDVIGRRDERVVRIAE